MEIDITDNIVDTMILLAGYDQSQIVNMYLDGDKRKYIIEIE